MAALFIVGDIPEEEGRKLEEENSFSIGFLLPDEAYGQKMLIYDKGMINLADGMNLWELLGSEKGSQLRQFIYSEIKTDAREDEDYGYPMSAEDIEKILILLDGLDEALLAITDKDYYIRPEYLEFVKSKTSRLLDDNRQQPDGSRLPSLNDALARAKSAAWFLRIGLRMIREHNCQVYCD
jgi:hypothetical protein